VLVADVEHGERLIHTNDPAALEALRHRPSHSTGTRRHVENLFIALQNKHFSQFLGEISADTRGSAIKLRRVLRIVEMTLVSVAMPVPMFVIVRVLMPVVVFAFMIMMMSVVMLVTVLGFVIMLVAMLMFVSVFMIVLMVVFVFAHGFAIPSNEIRLIFAHLHRR
jgi:hypothetical protein